VRFFARFLNLGGQAPPERRAASAPSRSRSRTFKPPLSLSLSLSPARSLTFEPFSLQPLPLEAFTIYLSALVQTRRARSRPPSHDARVCCASSLPYHYLQPFSRVSVSKRFLLSISNRFPEPISNRSNRFPLCALRSSSRAGSCRCCRRTKTSP